MFKILTINSLFFILTSSAFAAEIILSPGSKITVKPQVQTEVACSGISSNRCLIKIIPSGTGQEYVIVNQDDSILMSFDISKKTIDDVSYSLDMLKQKGICD